MMNKLGDLKARTRSCLHSLVAWHDRVFAFRSARVVLYCGIMVVATIMVVEWRWMSGDSGQILGNALGVVMAVMAAQWIAELNQKQNAKAVAAPIRAELLIYHELAIKEWRLNLQALEALNEGNDPNSDYEFNKLPPAKKDHFISQRSRLGELGAYLSHEIIELYTYLPNKEEFLPGKLSFAEDVCKNQRKDLLKIERIIDLLFALERTGETDCESLDEAAKSLPAKLSDRTNYPKKA